MVQVPVPGPCVMSVIRPTRLRWRLCLRGLWVRVFLCCFVIFLCCFVVFLRPGFVVVVELELELLGALVVVGPTVVVGEPVVIVTGPFAAVCGPLAVVVVVVMVTTTRYVVLLTMIWPHSNPALLLTLLGSPVVPVPVVVPVVGLVVPVVGLVGLVVPSVPVPAGVPVAVVVGALGSVFVTGVEVGIVATLPVPALLAPPGLGRVTVAGLVI
jgi:hypothetical protein